MSEKPIIVRFSPSPTGLLHIGGVRTALYNYLFAKQHKGKFMLRIEDTDRKRSTKESEENILESMKWLGFDWDNSDTVWRQTDRTAIYKEKIQELIKKGAAYVSHEEEGDNKEVVRFKNPGGKIKFQDLIRGEVEMEVGDINDFIIARNIDEPLYHLTVVVDDLEMGITHVLRAEEHISNTPRQILILEALGGTRPIYGHMPLILAQDKSKLSKRKHGEAVSLKFYHDKGYEKEAILNFVALLGWNPGNTEQEIFSLDELVNIFDLSKVQKKGAVFDIEKLNWMNREYILKEPKETQIENLKNQIKETKWKQSEKWNDSGFTEKFLKIIVDKIHRWGEVKEIIEAGEFSYFFETPELNPEKIGWKEESREATKENLKKVLEVLDSSERIMSLAEEIGKGNILWPLRFSLSGREKSPDPFTLLDILGIEESKKRVSHAIEIL